MITIASPTEAKKRRFTLPTGDFDIFLLLFILIYFTAHEYKIVIKLAAIEN